MNQTRLWLIGYTANAKVRYLLCIDKRTQREQLCQGGIIAVVDT